MASEAAVESNVPSSTTVVEKQKQPHKLERPWTFWYDNQSNPKQACMTMYLSLASSLGRLISICSELELSLNRKIPSVLMVESGLLHAVTNKSNLDHIWLCSNFNGIHWGAIADDICGVVA